MFSKNLRNKEAGEGKEIIDGLKTAGSKIIILEVRNSKTIMITETIEFR
jgi:hypothetical protein